MNRTEKLLSMLANTSPQAPLDLDQHIPSDEARTGLGLALPNKGHILSASLWSRAEDAPSYIGIRVKDPIPNGFALASDLVGLALERQIEAVFLSWMTNCGMQRFGCRVEHISGATDEERQSFERQIERFWNLTMIIDLDEFGNFS